MNPVIHMGLPSPGTDFIDFTLDLNSYLISNPTATFFMELKTNALIKQGIFSNDILVVDRSLKLSKNLLGIFESNGELKIKTFQNIKQDDQFFGTVRGIVRKLY